MKRSQLRIHSHMHTTHVTMSRDIALHDGFPRAEFHRGNVIHSKNFEKYENAEKSKKADFHLARVLKISRLCANFNRGNIFSVNDAADPQ